jgi:RES domain-containing protein
LSTSALLEKSIASSVDVPAIYISGLLDVAVREYSSWQQSRLGDEALKSEVRKACDVALDDGLDLAQIDEDKDPNYFKTRGVKWGITRRFVKDIRY